MARYNGLRCDEWTRSVRHEEVVEGVRRNVGALIGIGPQVEEFRDPQLGEWLGPDPQGAQCTLLLEHELPVFIAQSDEVAIMPSRAIRSMFGVLYPIRPNE